MHIHFTPVWLFGAQILDVLSAAVSADGGSGGGGGWRRDRGADPSRAHMQVTCVCAAALAGLDALARKYRGALLLKLFSVCSGCSWRLATDKCIFSLYGWQFVFGSCAL